LYEEQIQKSLSSHHYDDDAGGGRRITSAQNKRQNNSNAKKREPATAGFFSNKSIPKSLCRQIILSCLVERRFSSVIQVKAAYRFGN
jgi:hypothetical protein